MSDALSKTVPIWCSVLNRLLFPNQKEHHSIILDERYVGQDERKEIESRLEGFAKDTKVWYLH